MADKFVTREFWANLGVDTVGKSSERFVDIAHFASKLRAIHDELDSLGYDVVNVVPMVAGQAEACTNRGGAYLGDVGFSITRGAVVVGKRRN